MKTEAVRVAEINRDKELLLAFLRNPVVELMAGITLITYLNKGNQSWLESISGIDLAAGSEYAGLIAIIGLQQIAPLMPSLIESTKGTTKDIASALPSILALAAAG